MFDALLDASGPLSGALALDATIATRADGVVATLRDQYFTGVSPYARTT